MTNSPKRTIVTAVLACIENTQDQLTRARIANDSAIAVRATLENLANSREIAPRTGDIKALDAEIAKQTVEIARWIEQLGRYEQALDIALDYLDMPAAVL